MPSALSCSRCSLRRASWAADWPEIPAHCEDRSRLVWLEFLNCYHRYTFSHAMLRGPNLKVFAVVGGCVAICFLAVEQDRVARLRSLLQARLRSISPAASQDESSIAAVEGACSALKFLQAYSLLMSSAFLGVLLLVPFHLERPLMHYACTGLAAGSMFLGVCTYAAMPLGLAAGLRSAAAADPKAASDDLALWAHRHQLLRRRVGLVVALHFVLPAAAIVHHFAWVEATGRLFGACEVLTILSYQFFVAFLAFDDFAVKAVDEQKKPEELIYSTVAKCTLLSESVVPDAGIGG